VQHFLQNALPPVTETVIALLEPDMVLMEPVSPYLDVNSTLFHTGNAAPALLAEQERPCVSEGHPIAQVSKSKLIPTAFCVHCYSDCSISTHLLAIQAWFMCELYAWLHSY
jgi:hypothetical protein